MNLELLQKKQEEFQTAMNKEGFYIAAAAIVSGLSEDGIERYLKAELQSDKLMEILAAILDGLPDKTMELLASNSLSAEEMKTVRMAFRNDSIINAMREEASQGIQAMQEMKENERTLLEDFKKMAKKINEINRSISELQKYRMPSESEELVNRVSEQRMKMPSGKKNEMEEAAENAGRKETDMRIFTEKGNYEMECAQTVSENRNTVLGYVRKNSRNKLVNEKERAGEVKKILKHNPSPEQIEALTEAVKNGVSADFLQYYADKKATPEKLSCITRLYCALFHPASLAFAKGQAE